MTAGLGVGLLTERNGDLADWVAHFLWVWEDSGVQYGDAANALLSVVGSRLLSGQGELFALPEAEALLQALESPLD